MGMPALREALAEKCVRSNLQGHGVCVTNGANQAFVNLVLTLVDPEDGVVLFTPCYFDHIMTVTQAGGRERVVWGRRDPVTFHPDLGWLREAMAVEHPPRLVVLVNPCNPTGVLLSQAELEEARDLCAAAGAWLVVDETYEDFVYAPGERHFCVSGTNVVHIFSFSKAFGMMGWRVGYIAYPDFDGEDTIGKELIKMQDTICICASQLSQRAALKALQVGQPYVKEMVDSLVGNRALVLDALSPLGTLGNGVAGGEGAIYFWAKLPEHSKDDVKAVEWLVRHAGVCLIGGSSCYAPGYVRISYGNQPPERMPVAAARLKAGLARLVAEGIDG